MSDEIPLHAGPGPCPYCGSPTELRDSAVVYGRSYGCLWICTMFPSCDSFVGTHAGTHTPLGRLANKELRQWKKAAHAAFDPLWKRKLADGRKVNPEYPRRAARGKGYRWLADALGIDRAKCHIGMFDVPTCKRVVELCLPYHTPRGRAYIRLLLGSRSRDLPQ